MRWQEAVEESNLNLAYRIHTDINGSQKIIRNSYGVAHKVFSNCLIPIKGKHVEGYDDWEPVFDYQEGAKRQYRTSIMAKQENDETILKINQVLRMGLVYDPIIKEEKNGYI